MNWELDYSPRDAIVTLFAWGAKETMRYEVGEYPRNPDGAVGFYVTATWGRGGPDIHSAEIGETDTLFEAIDLAEDAESQYLDRGAP